MAKINLSICKVINLALQGESRFLHCSYKSQTFTNIKNVKVDIPPFERRGTASLDETAKYRFLNSKSDLKNQHLWGWAGEGSNPVFKKKKQTENNLGDYHDKSVR